MRSPLPSGVYAEASCGFIIQIHKWSKHKLVGFCLLRHYLHWVLSKEESEHNVENCTYVLHEERVLGRILVINPNYSLTGYKHASYFINCELQCDAKYLL